jgi:predicted transcriptional regulator
MEKPIKIRDLRQKEKFFVDDVYLNGYARILGITTTAVYLSLCRHANKDQECFPSQAKIAEEHNITARTVRNAIKKLKQANIIAINRERTKGGKWLNNVYILLDKSQWKKPEEISVLWSHQRKIKTSTRGKQRPNKDTHNKDTHNNYMRTAEPPALETLHSLKENVKAKQKQQKQVKTTQPSPHRQFVDFFYETVKKTRGIKPIITAKDARNLKRILDLAIIDQTTLEQLAVYFLAHPDFRNFAPTISTFLSQGILNGLQNRMQNDPNFWQEVSEFTSTYLRKPNQTDAAEIFKQVAKLKAHLFQKTEFLSPTERSRAQEEAAAEIRAAKS